jgi:hypothetical protein
MTTACTHTDQIQQVTPNTLFERDHGSRAACPDHTR